MLETNAMGESSHLRDSGGKTLARPKLTEYDALIYIDHRHLKSIYLFFIFRGKPHQVSVHHLQSSKDFRQFKSNIAIPSAAVLWTFAGHWSLVNAKRCFSVAAGEARNPSWLPSSKRRFRQQPANLCKEGTPWPQNL